MSRSIHTTRASVRKLKQRAFASEKDRTDALVRARRALRRKRRLKRLVHRERNAPAAIGAKTTADTVAVEVLDSAPHVHHATSPAEVRALLGLLPANATEGIERIRLSLGRAENEEPVREDRGSPDPFTGRLGARLLPGVYTGNVLGLFLPRRGLIEVYAYVVDPAQLPLPRVLGELYLRLHALKTLVHEVAHFHDHVARVRRGRWLADRKENLEWYAERMEHAWTLDVVLPYLERTYPKESKALRSWVRRRGGINLTLAFFAGDNRRTERTGLTWWSYPSDSVFENWLAELPRCASLTDSHLALAWELHFADKYDECLAILNRILAAEAGHLQARSCRADTLIHLERYDEALTDAEHVIAKDESDDRAWEAKADVIEHRHDWLGLLTVSEKWLAAARKPKGRRREAHRYLAIAFCALERDSEMDQSLAAYVTSIRFRSPEGARLRAAIMRRSTFRRAGRPVPPDPLLDSRKLKR